MAESIINEFIKVAARVPTGDNCQPFYFKIIAETHTFEIWHNPEIAKHQLNPQNLSSIISFGAMIELISWYSKQLNISILITTSIQTDSIHSVSDSRWGTVKIEGLNETNLDENSKAWKTLNNIKTFRSKFIKKSNHLLRVLESMKSMETSEPSLGFSIHYREVVSDLTMDHIASNDASIWKKQSVLKDLMKFAFLRRSTQNKMGIGFHWTELGMRIHESLLIPLVWSSYSYLMKPFFSTLIFSIAKSVAKKNIKSSSGYFLFSGKLSSLESFFNLGKATCRLRLVCSENGLCTQPFSIATFPLLMGQFSKERSFLSTENLETQIVLKNEFQIPEDKQAAWFFRVGPLPPKLTPTIRRSLESLIVNKARLQ